MNIVDFLKAVVEDFEEFEEPIKITPKGTIEIGDVQIPLYKEILATEKVILESVQSFQEKLIQDLMLVLQKIKAKTNHGDLSMEEAVLRLLNAVKNKGNYILREPTLVTQFDSSLISGYSELVSLYNPQITYNDDLSYEVESVLMVELRSFVNSHFDSWVNVGVQGNSLKQLVENIIYETSFIAPGNDQITNIIDILVETIPEQMYKDITLYEFAQGSYFILHLLAYTRLAVSHDFTKFSLISVLNDALDEAKKEFTIPDKKSKNKANPKEVEKPPTEDGGQTTEKQ
jgi:hypothetical protein